MDAVRDNVIALRIVTSLFERLNAEEITYCQWKSTYGLPKSLLGKTDFDLLISRADVQRFKVLLSDLDFKPLLSHPSRQYPAIEDYLGFDPATGSLVHLHVHYRAVLGEEYVKNYYPPLEDGLLAHPRLRFGIKIPRPAVEIIVLALRALLKYGDRDAARDLLGLGRGSGIPAAVRDEMRYLLAQTSTEQVAQALARYAQFLPPEVVLAFLHTAQHNPRDARTLVRLRRAARRALAPYQRHSRWRAGLKNAAIMLTKTWPFHRVFRRLLPRRDKHKTPVSGGLTVAFIGADGAGKSTIITNIVKWLSWRLVVRTLYMGSSRPSLATRVLDEAAEVLQLGQAGSKRLLGGQSRVAALAGRARRLVEHLRYLGDAHDRRRRFEAGQRAAARGAIVIYDRYPLEAVRVFNRPIDGPRIAATGNGHLSMLDRRLAAAEERVYQRIPPPDHVFVLHVSPEVSQARKPEHRRERIEAKSQAISAIARDELNMTDIDADQPLEQVLLQIKSALWRLL